MVVAFDVCLHARPAPADRLLAVYRFNLASFQLFGRVWNGGLLLCGASGDCMADSPMLPGQVKSVAELQTQYPAMDMAAPSRPLEIIDRIVRFISER